MEELDENLKNKLIKDQDMICINKELLFFDDMVFNGKVESPRKLFNMLKKDGVLENLNIQSICSVIGDLTSKKRAEKYKEKGFGEREDQQELIDKACSIIAEKMEKEDFYYNDAEDILSFTEVHTTLTFFNNINKELGDKIMAKYQPKYTELKESEIGDISTKITDTMDFPNFYHWYKEGAITPEKADFLREMYSKNPHAYEHFNFGVLKDDIYNNIPKEMIELTSKFPSLGRKMMILEKNNPKLFEVFSQRVNSYEGNLLDKYNEISNMSTGFVKIAGDIQIDEVTPQVWENAYNWSEFMCKIQDFDLRKYAKVDKVDVNRDFKEAYKEFLDNTLERVKEDKYSTEEQKKEEVINLCFRKKFAMSKKEAEKLLSEYGSDLDNLNDIDEQKKMFKDIEETLNRMDKLPEDTSFEDLDKMYQNEEQVYDFVNISQTKEKVSQECAKTYGEKLEYVDSKIAKAIENKEEGIYEQVEVDGQKVDVVKLTGKFDLFVHSTDSGFISEKSLDEDHNFKEEWNDGTTKTNHMLSTAYINQDFMGMAPVGNNGVMYAFSNVPRENIKLMGVSDINTYTKELGFDSTVKQFKSASTMANASRRVYSEFVLEKSTPDYVILMDDMSEEVRQNALKAAKDFGIPVVKVDKEEIVKQQVQDLNDLVDKLEETNDPEILSNIINKYETNVSGWLLNRKDQKDESHTQNIDNSRFKEYFAKVEQRIQDATTKYIEATKDNPDSLTKIAETLVKEQDLYELSREAGPDKKITGTTLSTNARSIMTKVNAELKNRGMEDFVVKEDTNLKQYLQMKEVAKNAVCRERTSMKQVDKSRQIEEIQKDEQSKNIE